MLAEALFVRMGRNKVEPRSEDPPLCQGRVLLILKVQLDSRI